uniref:Uncharacterized protein n=1 Tax=virus sp. ctDYl1 TaxID=2826795 RepID=A0A8S5R9U5_9VIRU|nr:MAG TPA: hypothetical protein [virus sp. ctDYl1]
MQQRNSTSHLKRLLSGLRKMVIFTVIGIILSSLMNRIGKLDFSR